MEKGASPKAIADEASGDKADFSTLPSRIRRQSRIHFPTMLTSAKVASSRYSGPLTISILRCLPGWCISPARGCSEDPRRLRPPADGIIFPTTNWASCSEGLSRSGATSFEVTKFVAVGLGMAALVGVIAVLGSEFSRTRIEVAFAVVKDFWFV